MLKIKTSTFVLTLPEHGNLKNLFNYDLFLILKPHKLEPSHWIVNKFRGDFKILEFGMWHACKKCELPLKMPPAGIRCKTPEQLGEFQTLRSNLRGVITQKIIIQKTRQIVRFNSSIKKYRIQPRLYLREIRCTWITECFGFFFFF